eukprot:SAG11_NODE_5526_length_1534_cov_17.765157_2_plen_83_part_00
MVTIARAWAIVCFGSSVLSCVGSYTVTSVLGQNVSPLGRARKFRQKHANGVARTEEPTLTSLRPAGLVARLGGPRLAQLKKK